MEKCLHCQGNGGNLSHHVIFGREGDSDGNNRLSVSHLALHAKAKHFVCQRRERIDKVESVSPHGKQKHSKHIQNADTRHVQEKWGTIKKEKTLICLTTHRCAPAAKNKK